MIAKARSVAPLALIVCASLAALLLKGAVEWLTDLLVTGAAGLAGRLKAGDGPAADRPTIVPRKVRGARRLTWRHAIQHANARPPSGYGAAPAWLFAEEAS